MTAGSIGSIAARSVVIAGSFVLELGSTHLERGSFVLTLGQSVSSHRQRSQTA